MVYRNAQTLKLLCCLPPNAIRPSPSSEVKQHPEDIQTQPLSKITGGDCTPTVPHTSPECWNSSSWNKLSPNELQGFIAGILQSDMWTWLTTSLQSSGFLGMPARMTPLTQKHFSTFYSERRLVNLVKLRG